MCSGRMVICSLATRDVVAIFLGAEDMLGIFAYICRQRPIIHW